MFTRIRFAVLALLALSLPAAAQADTLLSGGELYGLHRYLDGTNYDWQIVYLPSGSGVANLYAGVSACTTNLRPQDMQTLQTAVANGFSVNVSYETQGGFKCLTHYSIGL